MKTLIKEITIVLFTILSFNQAFSQVIFSDDFENNLDQWENDINNSEDFEINSDYQFNGLSSLRCLTTQYDEDYIITIKDNINLTGYNDVILSFWHIAKTKAYSFSDGFRHECSVEISEDGGNNWNVLPATSYSGDANLYDDELSFSEESYTNTPDWSDNGLPGNDWWKKETFSLNSYIGQNDIKIRFKITSQYSAPEYGWLIDDVLIENPCAPVATFSKICNETDNSFNLTVNITDLNGAESLRLNNGSNDLPGGLGLVEGTYTFNNITEGATFSLIDEAEAGCLTDSVISSCNICDYMDAEFLEQDCEPGEIYNINFKVNSFPENLSGSFYLTDGTNNYHLNSNDRGTYIIEDVIGEQTIKVIDNEGNVCYVNSYEACNMCNSASGFCADALDVPFPNNTVGVAPNGPDYGCLSTSKPTTWYFMQVQTDGIIEIELEQLSNSGTTLDLDFELFGPFETGVNDACEEIMSGTAQPIQGSFSASNIETVGIGTPGGYTGSGCYETTPPPAEAGQLYMLVMSNYSTLSGTIEFDQLQGGNGTGSGDIDCSTITPCDITNITTEVGACQPGGFTVSGEIDFNNAPDNGSIVISSSLGGITQTINAPFNSPLAYEISGINTSSGSGTITASFSENQYCTMTSDPFIPPSSSTPSISIVSDDADNNVCSGTRVLFTATPTNGGTTPTYQWKLNGVNVGEDADTFSGIFNHNDEIYCILTTNDACATIPNASSNLVTITIEELDLTLINNQNDEICAGETIIYTVNNGGTAFTFYVDNDTVQNSGSNIYTSDSMTNGQIVSVKIYNGNGCSDTLTSNPITYKQNLDISNLTHDVIDNTLCFGQLVTFTHPNSVDSLLFYTDDISTHKIAGDTVNAFDDLTYETSNIPVGNPEIDVVITKDGFCPDTATFNFTVNSAISVTLSPLSPTVCEGDTVRFSVAEIGQTAYDFKVDGVSQTVGVSDHIFEATGLTDGQVVTVDVDFANGCEGSSDNTTVSVNDTIDNIVLTVDNGNTFCANEQVDMHASPANASYSYEFFENGADAGNNESSEDYSSTYTADVSVKLIITDGNGCEAQTSQDLTINPNPELDFFASTNEICPGGGAVFTVNNLNGNNSPINYEFLKNDGAQTTVQDGTDNSYQETNIADGAQFWVIATQNGCITTSPIETINIVNEIEADLSTTNGPICQGDEVTVTALNGNKFAFYLNGAWVNQDSSLNFYTFDPADDGTDQISVLVRNGTCNDLSDPITIATADTPVASVSIVENLTNNTICDGECINFSVSSDGGFDLYTFYKNGTDLITTSNNASQIELCGGISLTTGDFVMVEVNNANCSANARSNSITVSPNPIIQRTNIPADNEICSYDSLIVVDNGNGSSINFYINDAFAFNGNVNTPYTFDNENLSIGTSEIKIISTTGSCETKDSFNVTINLEPSAIISAPPIICRGSELDITVATGNGNIFTFALNGTQVQSGSDDTYTHSNPNQGDEISLLVTNEAGCISEDNLVLNVEIVTAEIYLNPDETLCQGESIEVSTGGGFTYELYINDLPFTDGDVQNSEFTIENNDLAIGDNTIRVIAISNNNCQGVVEDIITVQEYDISDFTYGTTNIDGGLIFCAIDSITPILIDREAIGNWSVSPNPDSIFFYVESGKIDLGKSTPGTYNITFETVGNCSTSTTKQITILDALTEPQLGQDQIICNSTSTNISMTSIENGIGSWTNLNGDLLVTDNGSFYSLDSLPVGENTIILKISNSVCQPISDTVIINVQGVPLVLDAGKDIFCYQDTIFINARDHSIPNSGTWTSLSENIIINNPLNSSTFITGMTPTLSEQIVWSIEDTFCNLYGSDTLNLTNKYESIDIIKLEDSSKIIVPANFTIPENLINNWSWEITEEEFIINGGSVLSHIFYDPGTYTIILRGTDINGCTFEKKLEYKIYDTDDIFVPNMFTPNGDGDNDEIGPFGYLNLFTDYSFSVFNRWGHLVFQSNIPHINWNGKRNNTEDDLPSDGYSWMMRYADENGSPQIKKGYFILVR